MDDFDKQIREIKISRSAECFLDDIFTRIKKFTFLDEYPNSVLYHIENEILFIFNVHSNIFTSDYKKIYVVLKEKYNCDNEYILNLILHNTKKHLDIANPKLRYTSLHTSSLFVGIKKIILKNNKLNPKLHKI